MGLKQSYVNKNYTRDHLTWIIGNEGGGGDLMHEVCHTGYLSHGNSKGEARGRSRHKSNVDKIESSILFHTSTRKSTTDRRKSATKVFSNRLGQYKYTHTIVNEL